MTEQDRQDLADLAMRALDCIIEDYGPDAKLTAACLVFEVQTTDEDGDTVHHGNYRSLARNTATHIGGLMQSTAYWLLNRFDG